MRTTGFYLLLFIFIVAMNVRATETLSQVEAPHFAGTFDSIPAEYVAKKYPDGRIPNEVLNSQVQPFVLQVTRGWPGWYQNDFGYHYTLVDSKTESVTTIRGLPKAETTPWQHRVNWVTFLSNTIGLTACAALLHLAIVLFIGSIRTKQPSVASPPSLGST